MKRAGIVGISGYSGLSALEILLKHPHIRVTYVSANNSVGKVSDLWPQLYKATKLECKKFNLDEAIKKCDVIFLAVPHTVAMKMTPGLLKAGIKVIDISGDYRLSSAASYKKWYGQAHSDSSNLKKSVYGLPELYREEIKKADLVANPGCYPTAAILGLTPIVSTHAQSIENITIDAKSGITGAGRKAHLSLSFSELNENFKAYKPLKHQHVPEIELYLKNIGQKKLLVDFVPHLLPLDRGILETIYVRLNKKITLSQAHTLYKRFYKTEKFVRVLKQGQLPELKDVTKTNYCDIGLTVSSNGKLLVITSAIDNLMKGASSQAVQNMNLMFGFKEGEAIR